MRMSQAFITQAAKQADIDLLKLKVPPVDRVQLCLRGIGKVFRGTSQDPRLFLVSVHLTPRFVWSYFTPKDPHLVVFSDERDCFEKGNVPNRWSLWFAELVQDGFVSMAKDFLPSN